MTPRTLTIASFTADQWLALARLYALTYGPLEMP